MKTDRLGVEQLLQLTNPEDYPEELELQENAELQEKHFTKAKLNLRIPGIRKRKVTMFELVDALKKAQPPVSAGNDGNFPLKTEHILHDSPPSLE